MKIFWVLLFIITLMSCLTNDAAKVVVSQNEATNFHDLKTQVSKEIIRNKSSTILDCGNPDAYSIVIPEEENKELKPTPSASNQEILTIVEKKDQESKVDSVKSLNVVVGDQVVAKIKLPKAEEVKNFSLNSVKKVRSGFVIDVEWGGGKYYYYLKFYFRCREDGFYFYKVRTRIYEYDDNMENERWEDKEVKIEPNVPIEKFSMLDYLQVGVNFYK